MKMRIQIEILIVVQLLFCSLWNLAILRGQTADSDWNRKPTLQFSRFLDTYYIYDFGQPEGSQRQPFLFNYNRHNQLNINLAMIALAADHDLYRAKFAIHAGTYSRDNYAEEPGLLRNIFEAHIGLVLNQKRNLWLDIGILPSHIGFEGPVSIDQWTLSRSLLAENSPYFTTGARLQYQPGNQWELNFLILNGWQRIQRLEGNSLPAFGTQVQYQPSEHLLLNWSSWVGSEFPDAERRLRIFNNFFLESTLTPWWEVIVGFDIGMEQEEIASKAYNYWSSPIVINRIHLSQKWKLGCRAEYYADPHTVIAPQDLAPFRTSGLSINLDYKFLKWFHWRVEGRWLNSPEEIYELNNQASHNNFWIGTSLAAKIQDVLLKPDPTTQDKKQSTN